MERKKIIIRASMVGILSNIFLAGFKAVVGLLSGSVAIIMDAVNNLSDVLSSVITIIGTYLGGKKADKEHPYGHGRSELLSSLVIAVIILYAGITALAESVKKIITPAELGYSGNTLLIISAAILVKILLGRYVRAVGEKVHSDSLISSGKDAMLDAVISASTLAAAVIYIMWGIRVEAWLGALISLLIIKSGIEMLREAISRILGERPDGSLTQGIREAISIFPDVFGVYDIVLHNYGPETVIGSLHIEVPDTLTILELDRLERRIQDAVYEKNNVILAGIGIYARNTGDPDAENIFENIRTMVMAREGLLQIHGFFLDKEKKQIRFDLVMDYSIADRKAEAETVQNLIESRYPEYSVLISIDADVAD